jgi:hypothetical protein
LRPTLWIGKLPMEGLISSFFICAGAVTPADNRRATTAVSGAIETVLNAIALMNSIISRGTSSHVLTPPPGAVGSYVTFRPAATRNRTVEIFPVRANCLIHRKPYAIARSPTSSFARPRSNAMCHRSARDHSHPHSDSDSRSDGRTRDSDGDGQSPERDRNRDVLPSVAPDCNRARD